MLVLGVLRQGTERFDGEESLYEAGIHDASQ